jgi:hypothetical protein
LAEFILLFNATLIIIDEVIVQIIEVYIGVALSLFPNYFAGAFNVALL